MPKISRPSLTWRAGRWLSRACLERHRSAASCRIRATAGSTRMATPRGRANRRWQTDGRAVQDPRRVGPIHVCPPQCRHGLHGDRV